MEEQTVNGIRYRLVRTYTFTAPGYEGREMWLPVDVPLEGREEVLSVCDETIFLTAIEKEPDNQSVKLLYADWLDEQNRGSDADAMRWLAAKGKHPEQLVGWHWNSSWRNYSNLRPSREFNILPDEILNGIGRNNWLYGYSTLRDAIEWFFIGWAKATAQPSWFWRLLGYKAWVPDYTDNRPPKPPEGIRSGLHRSQPVPDKL